MIKTNSKKIEKGDTFVAMKGSIADGHDYIEEAILNGATKIIAERGIYSVDTMIVEDTTEYIKEYIKQIDIDGIKLIGVTGTNGKTTTCYLLYQALNQIGKKCAYIGTIGFYIDSKVKDLDNTTPGILEIYQMIEIAKQSGCEYVVMEVSSHALIQDRVYALTFDVGIITNVTRDHLDYHKTMEAYANAKQRLFTKIKKSGYAIIPSDICYKEKFLLEENTNITYGEKGDYQIQNINVTSLESTFDIVHNGVTSNYQISLLGTYNIQNMINVIIVLEQLHVKDIAVIIKNLCPPKGRMDTLTYKDSTIVIDYAHTPDAVENIIKTMRQVSKENIYTIIGCGGNRDKEKRPIMGNIATELSDYVIFTSDNPRDENEMDIIQDMVGSLEKSNYEIVINRQNAIIKGIQRCFKNDILLILGKGHEDYQIIQGEKIHFDDKEIVLNYIRR